MLDFVFEDGVWKGRRSAASLGGVNLQVYILPEGESQPAERQLRSLYSFCNREPVIMSDLMVHAKRYCQRIDKIVGLAGEGIDIDMGEFGKHFNIHTILIPELGDCDAEYVFLNADCDWEPERGMQVLVEDGRIIWCGGHTTLPFGPQWRKVIQAPVSSRSSLLREILEALPQP